MQGFRVTDIGTIILRPDKYNKDMLILSGMDHAQGDSQAGVFIVGSRGVVQLGDPVLACAVVVPLTLRLVSLFYSLKVPLKY